MSWTIWFTSSSSKHHHTLSDMMSRTRVVSGARPAAVARTVMSRSVTMPRRRRPSQTGRTPTFISSMSRAASWMVRSGLTTRTLRVMISATFMGFLSCKVTPWECGLMRGATCHWCSVNAAGPERFRMSRLGEDLDIAVEPALDLELAGVDLAFVAGDQHVYTLSQRHGREGADG